MGKQPSKSKSKTNKEDTVEIRLPRRIIDEANKLDAETLVSIVGGILGDYPLFGITKVDIRAHESGGPNDQEIRNKC